MKIKMENNKIILFLNKYLMGDLCIEDTELIEKYFRKIIIILMKQYDIKLMGEYNVSVYVNTIYGIILELEKTNEDDHFIDSIIDMKILFNINSAFLYKVDNYDYLSDLGDSIDKYYYNQKFYCNIKEIDDNKFLKLLEYSNVIYGEGAKRILKEAQKIK